MKFISVSILVLLVVGCNQPIKPTSIQFNFHAGQIYETIFNVGDEKVVHHWERLTGEWAENIAISSPALSARRFSVSGSTTPAFGWPDSYEIKDTKWSQFNPPNVSTEVPEKYKEYLRIARDLSAGNWPGVLPRSR